MSLRLVLIALAIGCALVVVAVDFGWVTVDGDPSFAGWLAASLIAFYASHLAKR